MICDVADELPVEEESHANTVISSFLIEEEKRLNTRLCKCANSGEISIVELLTNVTPKFFFGKHFQKTADQPNL